jgi:hypothetical protein
MIGHKSMNSLIFGHPGVFRQAPAIKCYGRPENLAKIEIFPDYFK